MTRYGIFLSIILCAGVLIFPLIADDLIVQSIPIALLGAAWIVLYLRGYKRTTDAMFIIFGLISIMVMWLGLSRWLALAGMILALLAWDLINFESRLEETSTREDVVKMERSHFMRLAMIVSLAVAGSVIASILQVDLSLGSALLLAVLGIWGISALVYRLLNRE